MKKDNTIYPSEICKVRTLAIKDTMEILAGKWKFHILGTLMIVDRLRFMELLREIDGIGAKMLSKELQDLELNQLIRRTVLNTKPITVEYEITEYGRTLGPIIDEIAKWGIDYRKTLHSKSETVT
ncbi:transcriptional regulator, HxlR family [Sphingobacterium nematocida]|uniref:Transcriptional regulator, HxlR family n=1 Tax=Sphingobacterium nematocida TaxID=1513896 RepID=A0A1T5GNB8_9SPHI|nr:helix-turn-helix domain-containing protein [Sphingobacterium nematocida]SKC09820.1 transcriptional regulator, HxlR family [Sphingobacterium nematocida]